MSKHDHMRLIAARTAAYNRGHNAGYDAANYATAYGETAAVSDLAQENAEAVYPVDEWMTEETAAHRFTCQQEYASGYAEGWDQYMTEYEESE